MGQQGNHSKAERPAWIDKLEKQIDQEELQSGLQGRREKVEGNFRSLMRQFQSKLKASHRFYCDFAWNALRQGQQ